jgi:uncharacterized protein YndB with AHSA1/START domain
MTEDDAILLSDDEGRSVLRFERRLPHSTARVWRALTERPDLVRWHPTPFTFQPSVGGRVTFHPELGGPEMPPGEVLAYEPGRILAYTWGEDVLRFELAEEPPGCVLVLTHSFHDRFKAARDGAGWHLCLAALRSLLDGSPAAGGSEGERLPRGWEELNERYEANFGIPHELATPPPSQ